MIEQAVIERVDRIRLERVRAVLDHPCISIGNLRIGTCELPHELRFAIVQRVFIDTICLRCGVEREETALVHQPDCRLSDNGLLALCRKHGVPAVLVERR